MSFYPKRRRMPQVMIVSLIDTFRDPADFCVGIEATSGRHSLQ